MRSCLWEGDTYRPAIASGLDMNNNPTFELRPEKYWNLKKYILGTVAWQCTGQDLNMHVLDIIQWIFAEIVPDSS